jgi:hypothetical protein
MPKSKGKPISRFTVLRWALHGRKGLKLKTLVIGKTRCTTDAWAMAFFNALTNVPSSTSGQMTDRQRGRDHADADGELTRAGFGD